MANDYLKYYENKRILVTGGAGAIGANLVGALSRSGAKLVVILDDLCASYEWNIPSSGNVIFAQGSVTDDISLKRVFSEGPQIVFHLAAFFANQNSVDYPEKDIMVNGMGTLKTLEYSRLSGVEKFIYASSGCSIYGNSPLPLKEEFVSLDLTTPYQITKMLGELYCNFFYHHYGLKTVKTRFFNSYGPGEVPGQYRNVIPNFIYWAMKGLPLPITGSGEETRDFTYVGDLIDGLLRAASCDQAVSEAVNLASGREIKIIDLANMVNEMIGNKAGVKFAQRRKWDTKQRLLASTDKARGMFGYEPKTDFREGISNTIKWFRENWELIEKSASFGPGVSSAVREVFNK
ncbi:MAG: NAD-dependent epimerase/dehydratase family protein [Candidatus Omnitrophica bacterium]|nr:NAD-dependent epimerase/dehydratase family protein [Candidatus Omnitrophota bacterium]MDD5512621.1 NAD-dependent epimerase/dehydratase family protein [Candidatus Omnitrophota bacterium]